MVNNSTPSLLKVPDSELLRTQPSPRGNILNLTQEQTQALFTQISWMASRGSYNFVSESGRLGKYQISAYGLKLLGFAKPTATDITLDNPDEWIQGGSRPGSKDVFLKNSGLQEESMFLLTEINAARLKNINLVSDTTSPDVLGGLIIITHFLDVTVAKQFYLDNRNITGFSGMSTKDYYDNGINAIKNLTPVVISIVENKNKVGA